MLPSLNPRNWIKKTQLNLVFFLAELWEGSLTGLKASQRQ